MLIKLNPILEAERKTEREFEAEWRLAAPGVLGVLLDALSCALRKLAETRLARSGRMPDFEQFVEAASSALEWDPGEFYEAMQRSRVETDDILIAESDVASAVAAFIVEEPNRTWEGQASLLLERLTAYVSDAVKRSRYWPSNASALGKALARFAPTLRRRGINCVKGHSGARFWKITSPAPELEVGNGVQPETSK